MKLATYRDGSRDGQLLVVSRDLSTGHYAAGMASRLQQVLDDWNFLSPQLEDLYTTLNHGKARHAFSFDAARCMAPLPRVFQWAVATCDDAPAPRHQAGDHLLGAHEERPPAFDGSAPSFEPRLVAITGDVAMGVSAAQALEGIRLLMLASDGGNVCSFSPVAATPDELRAAWRGGRVALNLQQTRPGERAQTVDASVAMRFHFGELMAQLANARPIGAGSLVGSQPLADASAAGEAMALDMKTADGQSVFGAIASRPTA